MTSLQYDKCKRSCELVFGYNEEPEVFKRQRSEEREKVEDLLRSVDSLISETFHHQAEIRQLANGNRTVDDITSGKGQVDTLSTSRINSSVPYATHRINIAETEKWFLSQQQQARSTNIHIGTEMQHIDHFVSDIESNSGSPCPAITALPPRDAISAVSSSLSSVMMHDYNTTYNTENKNNTSKVNEEKWTGRFEELALFKAKYGHVNVPRTSDEYKSLGVWLQKQLGNLKDESEYLTYNLNVKTERRRKLELLGVNFVKRKNYDDQWDENYRSFKRFVQLNGRAPTKRENKLGLWLCNQRKLLKLKPEEVTDNRTRFKIEKVKELFAMRSLNDLNWDSNFKELQEFVRGHGRLPSAKNDGKLGQWLMKQRFRNLKNPRKNVVDEEVRKRRYELLKGVGVSFNFEV